MIVEMKWHQVPTEPLRTVLPHLRWHTSDECSAACDTAALMLYVALIFMQMPEHDEMAWLSLPSLNSRHLASGSYEALANATSLSRSLIRQGLVRLTELGLIRPIGSAQKRQYVIQWSGSSWFKLPCRAIVRTGEIVPFGHFTMRSKRELHAMKLYLYLASIRDRAKSYSTATYETIHARTLIPERDIRRAISHLINAGLLRNVARAEAAEDESWGPNRYFFVGDGDLFPRPVAQTVAEDL